MITVASAPRTLFLSHGGGPLPLLGDAGHAEMLECLRGIATGLGKPSAIVVISAHWETGVPTVTAAERPGLLYDYYGFPEASYRIEYPCPGEPELANGIRYALENAHIEAYLDSERGLDHGVFVPLKIMYPEADIPVVQLSMLASLDPAAHVAIGKALRTLNRDNVLVIGSGFTFHNMEAFFAAPSAQAESDGNAFADWLRETCTSADLDEDERLARLVGWTQAPAARYCHPREEHLLPLHVCYGVAGTRCTDSFDLRILNQRAGMYLW